MAWFLFQSCQTEQEPNLFAKKILAPCDELDIIYYAKDTFVYKTTDTASINFFQKLITSENETLNNTCPTTGQLTYKNEGKNILKADSSTVNIKESISCQYVTYLINNKQYRHRLTYRHGMSIDPIYWEKVGPAGNPPDYDTTKSRYEDYKNSR